MESTATLALRVGQSPDAAQPASLRHRGILHVLNPADAAPLTDRSERREEDRPYMRILVTGGAGFIGSNFVRRIMTEHPDYEVFVLDALTYAGNLENLAEFQHHPKFSFWYGNVNNADLVHDLMNRVDHVVHFAAESHVARSIYDNSLFFVTDVLGTQTLANALLKCNHIRKFVHVSTSEVYGNALTEPMTEDHALNPMSPYASAKVGADRLVYSYWATWGIPAVIVRPFNNYGPYQHLEKVVPRFITSVLDRKPLTVHGAGAAMRDWLFVDDTCRAIDQILHAPLDASSCEAYNLGTGTATSVLSIAEMLCDIADVPRDCIVHIGDRPGQVLKHVADSTKAGNAFGWQSEVALREGLERTLAWYRDNESWWRRLEWMKHVSVRTTDGTIQEH
jgi:dTDP-glucose 4,6-dehydratase